MTSKGVVAAGHPATAEAAAIILREGGNAFDAIVAAHLTACVAEPVLTSLGGGGFLMARTAAGENRVYDFFPQTPLARGDPSALDFHPIQANFGSVLQEFHIGMASIATPGVVKGICAIHRDLCSLPMHRIIEPAVRCARDGVTINALQAYTLGVVEPIYRASSASRALYGSPTAEGHLLQEGEVLRLPEFANTLEAFAREGEALFYRGDIAASIVQDCAQHGGHLTASDLETYRVHIRQPLRANYRGAQILTNPPPSSGGLLIGFSLALLEALPVGELPFGSVEHLGLLARVMDLTNQARREHVGSDAPSPELSRRLQEPALLSEYAQALSQQSSKLGETTHVSVVDHWGNVAAMTVSNGEGSSYVVPGTGIMLNNMLGEEDINPHGFHRWPTNHRISSMMSPTLIFAPDGRSIAAGSGGSNRIRTAILQVLSNVLDFDMPLREAVEAPRVHFERGRLDIEGGFDPAAVKALCLDFPDNHVWEDRNLFFGGVHSTLHQPEQGHFEGVGDPRRGGAALLC